MNTHSKLYIYKLLYELSLSASIVLVIHAIVVVQKMFFIQSLATV